MTQTTTSPETDGRFSVPLRGVDVDAATRCVHYNSDRDVVAIRFPCCDSYYPCFHCHVTVTDHESERIPADAFDEPAVLCGRCRTTLTATAYFDCDDRCPHCDAAFNPGCRVHRDRYFAVRR